MYKLTPIIGNTQKLDGGAMFGNVPKALWGKWCEADDKNRISLSCRALLVQDEVRNINILLETGVGAFFDPTLKDRYGVVETEHVLLAELAKLGLSDKDIHYVVLSHLHFDHAGGLLSQWRSDQETTLLFAHAKYIVSEKAWERATHPHMRDRASFIPHLNQLLEKSGRLIQVSGSRCELLGNDFLFKYSDGHTPGMMMTEINTPDGIIIFVADLIPATPWVHLPITMGYDRYPEGVINEKQQLLAYALKNNARIFYTHDPKVAISGIGMDAKGKYIPITF